MVIRQPFGAKSECSPSSTVIFEEKPLETMQSNWPADGLTSKFFKDIFIKSTLVRFNARAACLRKTIFLGSRSRSVTWSVSSAVRSTRPGKPPPLPMSRMLQSGTYWNHLEYSQRIQKMQNRHVTRFFDSSQIDLGSPSLL